MNEKTEPQTAVAELVALVAKMREGDPYWRAGVIEGVIVHAANTGLTWPQTVVGLVRLAVDPEARPGELIPNRLDPTKPGRHDDDAYDRGLDAARKAMREAKAKITGEHR